MSDLLSAPRGELLKLVYELIEENQALKVQLVELREENQKLKENFQDKESKGKTPLFVKPSVKRKKAEPSAKRAHGFILDPRNCTVPLD